MSQSESRRIDELLKRIEALTAELRAALRPKPTSWVQNGAGGGEAVVGVTRAGGIAARSTSAVPHTFPSATIDLLNPDTGDFYTPNRTQVVYNSTSVAIGGLHIVQAKRIKDSERYFVDVDDCAVGSDGPAIEEEGGGV